MCRHESTNQDLRVCRVSDVRAEQVLCSSLPSKIMPGYLPVCSTGFLIGLKYINCEQEVKQTARYGSVVLLSGHSQTEIQMAKIYLRGVAKSREDRKHANNSSPQVIQSYNISWVRAHSLPQTGWTLESLAILQSDWTLHEEKEAIESQKSHISPLSPPDLNKNVVFLCRYVRQKCQNQNAVQFIKTTQIYSLTMAGAFHRCIALVWLHSSLTG